MATANFLGVAALLFWSMNVALTRVMGEAHPFGMPGLSFLVSGAALVATDRLRGKVPPWKSDADAKFWLLGGGAFVAYLLLYTGGLAYSDSRSVVLPLGLINYFWPWLILVLMPFFFDRAVRWPVLAAGAALCVVGVGCAFLWDMPFRDIAATFADAWPAFPMMLAAAFLWAFYSNAARKWGGTANGVGWFMIAGGLCYLALWLADGGPLGFTRAMLAPFLVHSLVVNACAYMFWDAGVRRGDIGLMGTLANFLPIGSVLFGSWYFGDGATPGLWVGALLVTLGAALCGRGLKENG